jgi:hypothetical protein
MGNQKLSEKIEELKREIIQVGGYSYPLAYVNSSFVEKMELEDRDTYQKYLKKMTAQVCKCLKKI